MLSSQANSWNDEWLNQLRIQACYVLRKLGRPDIEVNELISVAWTRLVRHHDSKEDNIIYTKRIRCAMYDYVNMHRRRQSLDASGAIIDIVANIPVDHTDFSMIDGMDTLAKVIYVLNKKERRVLGMRVEGLSWEEISKRMPCSVEGARKRYFRAINKLKETVDDGESTHRNRKANASGGNLQKFK